MLALSPYQLSKRSVIPAAPPKLYPMPETIAAKQYQKTPLAKANITNPNPVITVAIEIPRRQSSFLYHAAIKNIVTRLARLRKETTKEP